MRTAILSLLVINLSLAGFIFYSLQILHRPEPQYSPVPIATLPPIQPQSTLPARPVSKTIPLKTHVFQTFNNCGPASFSMLLSYVGIIESQAVLGQKLRPYQNRQGDNDDKNVFVSELAEEALAYGLLSYYRPNGTDEKLKMFISQDIPVLVRTWVDEKRDVGHYRIIRGYDDTRQVFIQDDSLQGKGLEYDYSAFDSLWKSFNNEYMVIIPPEKQDVVEAILKDEVDPQIAWSHVYTRAFAAYQAGDRTTDTVWSLAVSSYYLKNMADAIRYYEEIAPTLSIRFLWYQIEPVYAYYETGQYDKALVLTQAIFDSQNRAFSELYYLRGNIFKARGDDQAAIQEYERAVQYKYNYAPALVALAQYSI